jgi:dolichol-phosphate mannosyltransferase
VIGWSPLRQLISKGGSIYARLLLGLPIRDCTSGFKCFRRSALQVLNLDTLRSNGYAFQVEVNYACAQAGLRFEEVPIVFPDRAQGKSKMSGNIAAEAAWLVLRLRLGLSQPSILPSAQQP